MRRNDSTYYRLCLDESIDVLRDIEFIKIATAFIKSDMTAMAVTPGIFNDLSTIPQTIREVYDSQQIGPNLPSFDTQTWEIPHQGTEPGVYFIEIKYYPTVTKTSMDGYAVVTARGTKGRYHQGFQITYDDGNTWETIEFDTTTGIAQVTVPGICRGFKVRNKNEAGSTLVSVGYSLTTLNIPKLMRNIGAYAFAGCVNLSSVTFRSPIQILQPYTFYNCKNLVLREVPKSVVSIGNYCFYNCKKIPAFIGNSELRTIGKSAFEKCTGMSSLTINSTLTLNESAFALCSNLGTITINYNLPTILTDSTGNGTSFYGVERNGKLIMPNLTDSYKDNAIQFMSSEPGAYSHLADYSWTLWNSSEQVWPE